MTSAAPRTSAFDVLLPSVKEIRRFDDSSSLKPAPQAISPQGLTSVRVVNAWCRFRLNRYPVRFQPFEPAAGAVPHLSDSYAYEVRVNKQGIDISAKTEWGAITACSTVAALSWRGAIPFCYIIDEPAYSWRGLMLDTSRHFMPIRVLEETLDLMACYRLNVLHLNLSNDQACRFASRSAPKLAAREHYTEDELRYLVVYAAERAIRVVPELDVPGHTTSWVWAYPEWGAGELTSPSTGFGLHEACLDPTKPQVVAAIKQVFHDLSDVFPDEYVHIGGDEVNPKWWNVNDRIQASMRERRMSSAHELQTWFVSELGEYIRTLGKHVIGWDEVLSDELPQHFTIQAWRGVRARDAAVLGGHETIVSSPYYLDLFYPADYHYRYEPAMAAEAAAVADAHALDDPRLAHVRVGMHWQMNFASFPSLAKREGGAVIGGEGCMWSEIVDAEGLATRVWSRMSAIAERLWRGADAVDEVTMYRRLERGIQFWRKHLDVDGLQTLPRDLNPPALRSLIQQLEPVKWYARLIGMDRVRARTSGQTEASFARSYDRETPLNRLIDFLPPESFEARRVVTALHEADDLSTWCEAWRRQAEAIDGCVAHEARFAELRALSKRLAMLADVHQQKVPIDMNLGEPVGEYLLPAATPILHHALRQIGSAWRASGTVRMITKGHINDSFVIGESIFLQRINSNVFDVFAVLRNRQRFDAYIRDLVPACLMTRDGTDFVEGVRGEIWRATAYVEGRSFDVIPTELCEEAGAAFGKFLTKLQASSARPKEVIAGFHDLDRYIADLAALNPTQDAQVWLDFVAARPEVDDRFQTGDFQIIHGDCKVNNLLFETNKPRLKKIVDLDTLMWGHPAWDFGDLIRSVLTGSSDPAIELNRIHAVLKGFAVHYPIKRRLIESFAHAPAHMSFMLGVRFLADHLRGDTYFKVAARGGNLHRAAEQFALTERLTSYEPDIAESLIAQIPD